MRSKTKHYTVKVKKIYYYDPKKPSPIPCLPSTVELPPEIHDSCTDPIKEGQGQSQGKHMSFLPSRAFSIEVENLSFRKVTRVNFSKCLEEVSLELELYEAPELIRVGARVDKARAPFAKSSRTSIGVAFGGRSQRKRGEDIFCCSVVVNVRHNGDFGKGFQDRDEFPKTGKSGHLGTCFWPTDSGAGCRSAFCRGEKLFQVSLVPSCPYL